MLLSSLISIYHIFHLKENKSADNGYEYCSSFVDVVRVNIFRQFQKNSRTQNVCDSDNHHHVSIRQALGLFLDVIGYERAVSSDPY